MTAVHTTIIIPAYNEEAYIGACIESLLHQKDPKPFEIIVVDNGSSDNTASIAKSHGVKVIRETIKGVCAARQAGFKQAKGDIIISSDADCTYSPGWLKSIQDSFDRQPDISAQVGTYRFTGVPPFPNMLLATWEAITIRLHYAFGWQLYVSASNLAFRRSLFTGYNTKLTQGGDEIYVIKQLRKKGRILYHLETPVHTSSRRVRKGLFRTLLVDFIVKYLVNYVLTLLLKRNLAGSYQAHRSVSRTHLKAKHERSWIITFETFLMLSAGLMLIAYGLYQVLTVSVSPEKIAAWLFLSAGIIAYFVCSARSQLFMPAPFRFWTKQKIVALTFDDGPNEPYTKEIASIIESYGGQATFFQCGASILKNPESTRRLATAGHTIGNHTYSHNFSTLFWPAKLHNEILATNKLIEDHTGKSVRFFRSPWLIKHPVMNHLLQRIGLTPISGLIASRREIYKPDGARIAAACLKEVRPGMIIIFHESRETHGGNHTETVKAVRIVCHQLHSQGYRFVSLDNLL